MDNSEIIKDIKSDEYNSVDKYDIVKNLLKKGYPESSIIDVYDHYRFKQKWSGNILGVFMIVLSILIYVSIRSTFGGFDFEFDSEGDVKRFSEWVMKPFLGLATIFVGILILVNRGLCNRSLKRSMIIFYCIFLLVSVTASSPVPLLYALIGIILFSIMKIPDRLNKTDGEYIVSEVKRKSDKYEVLKRLNVKQWRGTSMSVFVMLAFVLFLNAPIMIKSGLENISLTENGLTLGLMILIYGSPLVGIMVGVNKKLFRYAFWALVALSVVHMLIVILYGGFQDSMFPCILMTALGLLWYRDERKNQRRSSDLV